MQTGNEHFIGGVLELAVIPCEVRGGCNGIYALQVGQAPPILVNHHVTRGKLTSEKAGLTRSQENQVSKFAIDRFLARYSLVHDVTATDAIMENDAVERGNGALIVEPGLNGGKNVIPPHIGRVPDLVEQWIGAAGGMPAKYPTTMILGSVMR
jgi:hypothetical protein